MPCPPPGDLPDPGIEPRSPALQTDALLSEPPGKPICIHIYREREGEGEKRDRETESERVA